MIDKELARKILNKRASDKINGLYHYDSLFELMQAYHEAKMKEVTDEDIVDYSRRIVKSSILCYSPLVETGIIIGAWAIRDGKIKHVEK